MSFGVAKTIAIALVSSRLDYCLYHNIAHKDILKLQRVQNCLARVVTRSPRFSHSVPALKSLHWLPVRYRILLRSVQLRIKYFHPSNQHIYIHCSLQQNSPRSFDNLIIIYFFFPSVKTNVGTRVFSVAAPTLWNSLPVSVKYVGNIKKIRRKLKAHLFQLACILTFNLSSIAPQRSDSTVYNWNCLSNINCLIHSVSVRCRS